MSFSEVCRFEPTPHDRTLSQISNALSRIFAIYPLQTAYRLARIRASGRSGEQERSTMQAQVTREWVTYRQAEEIAGLSRTTLRKLVDEGDIQIKRVGRAVRINRQSLDAYMRGDTEDGTPSLDARTE